MDKKDKKNNSAQSLIFFLVIMNFLINKIVVVLVLNLKYCFNLMSKIKSPFFNTSGAFTIVYF